MSTALSNRDFIQALGLAVTALVLSAALLLPGYLLLVPVLHPEFRPYIESERASPVAIPGNRFQPVVFGEGGFEGDTAVISALAEAAPEDHAVLVHRQLFRADQFSFLRYHIEGRNPALRVMLFWQREDTPGENYFAELDYSSEGPRLHNLLRNEEWRGTITELAVGLFGDLRGGTVKLNSVVLEPYSHRGLLQAAWAEWNAFAPWDQSSINVYRGVPDGALIFPVPAIAAWLATSIAIILLWRGVTRTRSGSSRPWLPAGIAIGIAWAALDALWLQQLLRQNAETRYLFAGTTLHEKKLADWDGEYYAASHAIKDQLGKKGGDLIILYQTDQAALAQRMRFHLLPEFKATIIRPVSRGWVVRAGRKFNHVIVVSGPGTSPASTPGLQELLTSRHTTQWDVLEASGPIVLYATNGADGA